MNRLIRTSVLAAWLAARAALAKAIMPIATPVVCAPTCVHIFSPARVLFAKGRPATEQPADMVAEIEGKTR
jgi:hypothetical protein